MRSFADTNGDGLSDLAGVTRWLDSLNWLGVDVDGSPLSIRRGSCNHDCHVSDYCAVSAPYGTLKDPEVS